MLGHTAAMLALTLVLVPVGGMGWVYTVTAVVAGALFGLRAVEFAVALRRGTGSRPMRLFRLSITYLSLLFLAVAVDPFVG